MTALTPEDRKSVLEQAHGGPEALALFNVAMDAVHAYARASGCPIGRDVFRWAEDQQRKAHEALRGEVTRRLTAERAGGFHPVSRARPVLADTSARGPLPVPPRR